MVPHNVVLKTLETSFFFSQTLCETLKDMDIFWFLIRNLLIFHPGSYSGNALQLQPPPEIEVSVQSPVIFDKRRTLFLTLLNAIVINHTPREDCYLEQKYF